MSSDSESDLEERWAEVDKALDEELPFGAGAPEAEEDEQYYFILQTVAPGGNLFQARSNSGPEHRRVAVTVARVVAGRAAPCRQCMRAGHHLRGAGHTGGRLGARQISSGTRVY